jgi:hypothetical protein
MMQLFALMIQIFAVGAFVGFAWSSSLLGALIVTLKEEHTATTWRVVRRLVAAIVTRAACWGVDAMAVVAIVVGWNATESMSCAVFFSDLPVDGSRIRVAPPPECVNAAVSIAGDARGYWVVALGLVVLALSVSIGYWRLRGGVRAVYNTSEVATPV